jgi:hypothetical protein
MKVKEALKAGRPDGSSRSTAGDRSYFPETIFDPNFFVFEQCRYL